MLLTLNLMAVTLGGEGMVSARINVVFVRTMFLTIKLAKVEKMVT